MFKSDLQQQFWLTKKIVQRKLGGKEDECIQDSDAPLDSKICLFTSISTGCYMLQKLTEQLVDKLDAVSGSQNALGKFLNDIVPQTCPNAIEKYTSAIGKALSYESQQVNTLRPALVRFEHELTIFNNHAVRDASDTVVRMEKERTEYRAALSWMKSASQNMDPESCKDVQKFRKTQNLVKKSKQKFEQEENTCFQKIDLLSAARCNMLSHALTPYQTAFLSMMKNVVGVYASTLEYLKQCDVNDENILSSLKKELTVEDQNRLLFFENEYKDVDEADSKPKEAVETKENESSQEITNETEQNLLFDLGEDSSTNLISNPEPPKNDLSDLLDNFSFWNHKTTPDPKQPMTETAKKNQDWFNIFSELDPLANNNGNIPFTNLQNSEAT
ncbi:islet cell autoantigen 1 [Culicoides brevitarsis]|uniref:islet cell autoantigen 1 n=1 Tax=Culicoides brevitarsis TaxID=469753 RepID=UPI00307CB874